jgi:hypothetical protein
MQKTSNVRKAMRKVRESMRKAQKRGITIVTGDWGVEYNTETGEFQPDSDSNPCACAFGACLLVRQPKVEEKTIREYAYGFDEDEKITGTLGDADFLAEVTAKSLGLPKVLVEKFIQTFDEPEDYKDLVRKSVVRSQAVKLSRHFVSES